MIRTYSIRDLEKLSGVSRTTIHFYLRQGLLPRAQKAAASRSLYTDEHVHLLKKIAELKRQGLSLAEIAAELEVELDEANESSVDLAAQEHRRMHNRILAAAAAEFAAKGYKNTHVTTIMRQLGITATLFYSHFPSKRRLLTECVTILMDWSGAFADRKRDDTDDPAEQFLWNVFGHRRAFELGSAALAVVRLEAGDQGADLERSMADALVTEVDRIREALDSEQGAHENPSRVPGELVALDLFASFQPLTLCRLYDKYGPEALLQAQLWLFLAAQAARNGEVDIDMRLARYQPLITSLAAEPAPLPPELVQRDVGRDDMET